MKSIIILIYDYIYYIYVLPFFCLRSVIMLVYWGKCLYLFQVASMDCLPSKGCIASQPYRELGHPFARHKLVKQRLRGVETVPKAAISSRDGNFKL